MALANNSPFAALAVPSIAPDGREVVIAVVKATFTRGLDGRIRLADAQVPVRVADVVYDPDAVESSIRYPSDVGTEKRGTDVVVVGEAVSVRAVRMIDVTVRIRDRAVPLRVHGERLYYRRVGGIAVGPPAPFERKAIVYERAYGGASADGRVIEPRNPVGRGVTADPASLVDTPAPQIEHPAHPITSADDAPEPVGFGAIATHWLPRAAYAGTLDDAWRQTRMPLMPLDFDARFNNVAHPSLQLDEHLKAGEPVAILGMTEGGLWQAEIPAVPVSLHGRYDDRAIPEARPMIDTLLIEPGRDEIQITLRHVLPMGRGRARLREIQVDTDG